MTTAWIAYSLVVSVLLAATARWLANLCQLAARPARWVWAGAIALTLALSVIAPRRAAPPTRLMLRADIEPASVLVAPTPSFGSRMLGEIMAVRRALTAPAQRVIARAETLVPASLDRALGALWLGASAALLLLFASVYARMARRRYEWPLAELHGMRVRISPEAGPVVVGLSPPEIVVPRWLLLRSEDEQRIVLEHEREHVRARDPLLLAAACAVAALLPWNPAVWWMLSRLQLAVELDCDARVLRRGIAPRSYGALLIDLAGRCSGLPLGAPALADRPSQLERRLLAMRPDHPRFARVRGGAFAALALIALAAACEARMPTSADVAEMDVTKAQHAAGAIRLSTVKVGDSATVYTLDGVRVTAERASALKPSEIASIEVSKISRNGAGSASVNIRSRAASGDTSAKSGEPTIARFKFRHLGAGERGDSGSAEGSAHVFVRSEGAAATALPSGNYNMRRFDGLVIVDGVRKTEAELAAIPPNDIVSVSVTKGPEALKLYPDAAAANGVIRVTTKRGAQR